MNLPPINIPFLGDLTDPWTLFALGGAFLLMVVFLLLARREDFRPRLRPIRGYDAARDAVGQAIETGGRVHVALGPTSLVNRDAGVTLAGLALLSLVTDASAVSDRAPVATTSDATALAGAVGVVRAAYRRRDKLGDFSQRAAQLVALDQLAMAAGTAPIIDYDRVQANLLAGSFGPEAALILEAGHRKRIPQVAGSDRLEGQAAAYVMADHPLIGEEMFVPRAYLSEQPAAIAGAGAQDMLRWLVIGAILLGALARTVGLI